MPEPPEEYTDNDPLARKAGSRYGELIYGNDIDSVDVAIRAALVNFFTAPSVNGDFSQHCSILRLYSRPVVAFQKESFIITRPVCSDFMRALSETQVV